MKIPPVYLVDFASNVFPVAAGIFKRRFLSKKEWLFFFFTVAALSSEVITFTMARNHLHNLWVLQIYSVVLFILLTRYFAALQPVDSARRIVSWSILPFALFWIYVKWSGLEGFTDQPKYTHTAVCAILTMLASVTMYMLVVRQETLPLWKDARFWATAGVLLYFAGNIALFLMSDRIAALSVADAVKVWTLHWSMDIVSNILYTVSFLCLSTDN